MIEKIQPVNEAINIADWPRDEEFEIYPEGAREKTLVHCPTPAPYSHLIAGHKYLFKRSPSRYPEQFWVEIFAYHLGSQMGVQVPHTYIAFDSKTSQSGALIEWFLYPLRFDNLRLDSLSTDSFISGGDFCEKYIPDFDRKKGKQHNFETVCQIFEDLTNNHPFHDDWKNYWAKTFVFDALIGNTDRHQDNWGIIGNFDIKSGNLINLRISPVFDNGTSMGHEIQIPSNKYKLYEDDVHLNIYVRKGKHHIKWRLSDISRMMYCELLKKLADKYPETRSIMLTCLQNVNDEVFNEILNDLTQFDIPVKLSVERAAFMLRLLQFRHQYLLRELEK